MPINLEADIHLGERPQDGDRHRDPREANDGFGDVRPNLRVLLGKALAKACWVGLPFLATLNDLYPLSYVLDAFNVDGQTEPVQQLRPEVSFLRVHRANQDEARRMPDRNPLALHHVHAHGGRLPQYIDQAVVQQIHLVDIKNDDAGFGYYTRLQAAPDTLHG